MAKRTLKKFQEVTAISPQTSWASGCFSAILMLHNKTTSAPTALGTINLHKCAQRFAYS